MKALLTACAITAMASCAYQEAPDTNLQLTIHRLRTIENTVKDSHSSGLDMSTINSVQDLFVNLDNAEVTELFTDGWGKPWVIIKQQDSSIILICSQGRLSSEPEFPNSPLLRLVSLKSGELITDIMCPQFEHK